MPNDALLKDLEALQNLILEVARENPVDNEAYRRLRQTLTRDPRIAEQIPQFVRDCRDREQLSEFLSSKYGSNWSLRKTFVWSTFRPLLDEIEFEGTPVERHASVLLREIQMEGVLVAWERALSRREEDPAGAITAARTLIETVCKHILDEANVAYQRQVELPALYQMTAEVLNIAPSQHSEQLFKRILGGCTTVVEALGALRNSIGDAHGAGRQAIKPAPRHAQLAVDLAGAVAVFLFQTAQARKAKAG